MQKHIVLSAIGLILGLLALAWVRPQTPSGATLLVLLVIAIVNAFGAFVRLPDRRP
jgi:multisubunit Na+/H+ antiporter MnhG subunit